MKKKIVKYEHWRIKEYKLVRKDVVKLRKAAEALLKSKGGLSSGATVNVDYFALNNVLDHCDDIDDLSRRLAKLRVVIED